jgi:RNA polymerase sigma factor (sigma-70 family)
VRLFGMSKDEPGSSRSTGRAQVIVPSAGVGVVPRGVDAVWAIAAPPRVGRHRVSGRGDARHAMTMADGPETWLCAELEPRLIGALTLYCGDRLVAEELAQDTLVRVLDRWEEVQQLTSPAAWAHRVAINLANSRFRRLRAERRARQRLEGRITHEPGVDVAAHVAVRQAVARLPRRQRTALVLRYFADLPVGEVAALMECSPGTVKSLTHHAIGALRRTGLMDDGEGEVRGG